MTKLLSKLTTAGKILLGILFGIILNITIYAFKPAPAPPESAYRIAKIGIVTEVWKVQDNGTIFYVVLNTSNGNTSVTKGGN